jgi:hypothetical protein
MISLISREVGLDLLRNGKFEQKARKRDEKGDG